LKPVQKKKLTYLVVTIIIVLLVGAVSTYIHFQNHTTEVKLANVLKVNAELLAIIFLVFFGLIVRFFKWHFFLRIYDIRLKIRKSFLIFFASLFLNIFFPFLIGELFAKNYFLKKEGFISSAKNFSVIILERMLDILAIVLMGILFFFTSSAGEVDTSNQIYIFIVFVLLLVTTIIILMNIRVKSLPKIFFAFIFGLVGWLVIYALYFTMSSDVTKSVSFFDFSYIFSNYLLFYPATPMGIFLSGNYLFSALENIVLDRTILFQTVINIRIASVVPSLIVGGVAFIKLLCEKKTLNQFHFDEISDDYTDLIPQHIRERLLERKCRMIYESLQGQYGETKNLIGLDLGGGKGWYTSRLIDMTGAKIILVEKSANQASDAAKRDNRIETLVEDIEKLPYADSSIDFAFSINVIHHLDDREAQLRAFECIGRVLKPGGKFFLHEINVRNIFFKLYMNYFFPLVKTIDEGIEYWIDPQKDSFGKLESKKIIYFTFLPDFISFRLLRLLDPIEHLLEKSFLKVYSAHYFREFVNKK